MAQQAACRSELEAGNLCRQRVVKTAGAGDHQRQLGMWMAKCRDGIDEQVEPLLRLQPAYRPDEHRVGRDAQLRADFVAAAGFTPKALWVDTVHYHADSGLAGAVTQELVANFTGHRDHARKSREQPFIRWIVQVSLPPAVTRPAVSRRQWQDADAPSEHPGEQIGLVVVRVHHVNSSAPDESCQLAPNPGIQRVALDDLDVID